MLRPPNKSLIVPGVVLASAALGNAVAMSFLYIACFDHHPAAMMCSLQPPDTAHGPEHDRPEPMQAQRILSVTASSTSVQFNAIATGTGFRVRV